MLRSKDTLAGMDFEKRAITFALQGQSSKAQGNPPQAERRPGSRPLKNILALKGQSQGWIERGAVSQVWLGRMDPGPGGWVHHRSPPLASEAEATPSTNEV